MPYYGNVPGLVRCSVFHCSLCRYNEKTNSGRQNLENEVALKRFHNIIVFWEHNSSATIWLNTQLACNIIGIGYSIRNKYSIVKAVCKLVAGEVAAAGWQAWNRLVL